MLGDKGPSQMHFPIKKIATNNKREFASGRKWLSLKYNDN